MQNWAVTVRLFKISSGVCSRLNPHCVHSLRFRQMDRLLPGVMKNGGGDSSVVRDQLKGVQQIQATWRAFTAILADGSVVTWGS